MPTKLCIKYMGPKPCDYVTMKNCTSYELNIYAACW